MLLNDVLFRRLGTQGLAERSIVMTLGLSLFLQNGALALLGAQPQIVDSGYDLSSVHILGTRMSTLQIFAGLAALVAGVGLYLLLQHTALGRAMRALSQNREGAIVLGIRAEPIARFTVALGAAYAGLAGAALGSLYTVDPTMGIAILFKSFAIVIVGGVGNVAGTAAAALLIGVTESLAGGYGSRVLQDASAFLLMIVVLLWRPQGLFGRSVRV
jgi:branched-chain amino acid transport system permease protein